MSEFTSDNQPKGRGRSFKTKLFEVIRNESLLDLEPNASIDTAENAYLKHFATRAFDSSDQASGALLKELLSKSYPGLKATMPTIDFDLPENSTPIQKANAILKAVSEGGIPPDVGALLIQAAKYTIDIEIGTEMKERIEKIEESLGLNV
jgi:hypothetical protein